jgi:hypothetical protein
VFVPVTARRPRLKLVVATRAALTLVWPISLLMGHVPPSALSDVGNLQGTRKVMRRLSYFWTNLAWDQWLYGLFSSIIGGGATAASGMFTVMGIDPEKFNFNQPWNLVKASLIMFVVSGLAQMWAYLKQNSLPGIRTVEKTTETTQIGAKPPVVVETVKETVVAPVEKTGEQKS